MTESTVILPALKPRPAVIERLSRFLASLPPDKAWRVTVSEHKQRRSDQQNRYLWGVAYPAVLEGGGESLRGWTAEDLHEYFLGEHFGWEVVEGFGKRRQRPIKRSSRLSKTEFSDFVAAIQLKAAELGIFIPDPEGP